MIDIRPGTDTDLRPAFEVFRRSLWDLLQRNGVVPLDLEDDVDRAWAAMREPLDHLARHASEFWVAEGEDGLAGMARSIERDDVLQLTEFFVDPAAQATGLGRALLEKAFPTGRGRHRSIIATMDPPAMSLYLRSGVSFQTLLGVMEVEPRAHSFQTDLDIVPLSDAGDPVGAIAALDRRYLDHERILETEFVVGNRPGYLVRRGREVVGYGFGPKRSSAGPVLVADPADLPAVLSHIENEAAEASVRTYDLKISLDARTALDWALARGHRLSPFFTTLLGSSAFVPRDRYVVFTPALFL